MSDEPANGLHLPDVSISNFRGIGRLSILRLGRVALLGGRNGVCKTTVLDAVRTYAARGSRSTLHDLLGKREEYVAAVDEGHDAVTSPDFGALFHGRTDLPEEADVQAIRVVYRGRERLLPWLPVVNAPRANWLRLRYPGNLLVGQVEEEKWPVVDSRTVGSGRPPVAPGWRRPADPNLGGGDCGRGASRAWGSG